MSTTLAMAQSFSVSINLWPTKEKFPLKGITPNMKIKQLKQNAEYACGIPFDLQRLSYLDTADILDTSEVRHNDVIPGATLDLNVWPMWRTLVEAVATGDSSEIMKLGVTQDTKYHTPNSDQMLPKAREEWISNRAFTALYMCAHRGDIKSARKLIDAGANVNGKTHTLGRTPLHVAAANDQGKMVTFLLERGAEIDGKDIQEETALDVANHYGNKDCERHLFLYQWQQRAKKTKAMIKKKSQEFPHQRIDSGTTPHLRGSHQQMYCAQIPTPDEFSGTRLDAPQSAGKTQDKSKNRKNNKSYDEWLQKKKKAEQKIITAKKQKEELERIADEERKQEEVIKDNSYERWLQEDKVTMLGGFGQQPSQAINSANDLKKLTGKQSNQVSRGMAKNILLRQQRDAALEGRQIITYENWLANKDDQLLEDIRHGKTPIHRLMHTQES